jgi:hypothetical protein
MPPSTNKMCSNNSALGDEELNIKFRRPYGTMDNWAFGIGYLGGLNLEVSTLLVSVILVLRIFMVLVGFFQIVIGI